MKKKFMGLLICVLAMSMMGCSSSKELKSTVAEATGEETVEAADEVTMVLAAAASLKYVFDDQLIPMFEEANPGIHVEATYDSSGKLQTQIEEGADWDVFFSAGKKQMDALAEQGLVKEDSIKELLLNELVLIVPEGNAKKIESVQDILNADTIAIGDPADVPVGQYTQKVLTELELWDLVMEKEVSLGTNVTEVLSWIAEASADCGFTYRTDAYQRKDEVDIIEGLAPATYPVAIVASTTKEAAAESFVQFLSTKEALAQFEAYGFTPNK